MHTSLADAFSVGTFRCVDERGHGAFDVQIAPAIKFANSDTWGAAAAWSGTYGPNVKMSGSTTIRWMNDSANAIGATNRGPVGNRLTDELALTSARPLPSCSVIEAGWNDGASPDWGHELRVTGHLTRTSECFDETYYLAHNPDVAAAVKRGDLLTGRHHYERHGRGEGRTPCPSVDCFDASFYLQQNPDVAAAVKRGAFPDARSHYVRHGRSEGRAGCPAR